MRAVESIDLVALSEGATVSVDLSGVRRDSEREEPKLPEVLSAARYVFVDEESCRELFGSPDRSLVEELGAAVQGWFVTVRGCTVFASDGGEMAQCEIPIDAEAGGQSVFRDRFVGGLVMALHDAMPFEAALRQVSADLCPLSKTQ